MPLHKASPHLLRPHYFFLLVIVVIAKTKKLLGEGPKYHGQRRLADVLHSLFPDSGIHHKLYFHHSNNITY